MALVGGLVVHFLADRLAVLDHHLVGHPAASVGAGALEFLNARLQRLVLLVGGRRRIQGLHLLGAQIPLHAVLKNRNPVHGNRHLLVGVAGLQADGRLGVVDKPEVRLVVADRGVLSGSDIGGFKGVGTAVADLQPRAHHRVVQGGGHLAHASADLLNHLAVVVGGSAFIALLLGALAHRAVEGKLLAGLYDGAVDGLGGQTHVGVPVLVGRGVRGEGADGLVFLLGGSLGDLRLYLAAVRRNPGVELLIRQSLQNIGRQLVLVDGKARLLPGEHKGILFLVIALDGAVLGALVPLARSGLGLSGGGLLKPGGVQAVGLLRFAGIDLGQQAVDPGGHQVGDLVGVLAEHDGHIPGVFFKNGGSGLVPGHARDVHALHRHGFRHLGLRGLDLGGLRILHARLLRRFHHKYNHGDQNQQNHAHNGDLLVIRPLSPVVAVSAASAPAARTGPVGGRG